MKTTEELNALKNEVETMNRKLAELNDEELSQVTGGAKLGHYMYRCDNPGCRRSIGGGFASSEPLQNCPACGSTLHEI